MKIYKNISYLNRDDLSPSSLLFALQEQLENSHPNLGAENLMIVADLMMRYDEDVTESNGQFTCPSLID